MKFIIGCSGFHYKHWRGDFYPDKLPVKKWFEFYSEHFNTLEINASFYRFPTLSMLTGWYEKSPANFSFSLKAPRSITHFKKFLGTTQMIKEFYEVANMGLKEKLGCVLFQLPPNFWFSPEHLQRIINALDPGYNNVVEFRHPSWWIPEVYDALREKHIAFCGMSHPDFPHDVIHNTDFIYYRMHGNSQLYASNYSDAELKDLYKKIAPMKGVKNVFIYFNNDINGFATKNAAYLIQKASVEGNVK